MGLFDKIFGTPEKKKYESVSNKVKFLDENGQNVDHTIPIEVQSPKQQYIIKSGGEYYVYDSKEEMSEELRNEIKSIETIDQISSSYSVIIDGKRQLYSSYDQIPEEIRNAVKPAGS